MAILSKEDEDGKPNNKDQRIKVISTKIPADHYDSFSLLIEYLSKAGVIQTSTPSALLRNNITQLLTSYRDDIENYRITKKQGTVNNNGHQLRDIENNQILGNGHLHLPVNDDRKTHHTGVNSTLANGCEYPQEKVLSMSNKNHEPSSIQSTQEELKEPQEMEAIENREQPKSDPIANLYKLDLAKYMYTLVMLDRRSKNKLICLEVDETTKEVVDLIPSYDLK